MKLPPAYSDLAGEGQHPAMLFEALSLFGVHEAPGASDSPTILRWAADLGLADVYVHDAIPWCGLFQALVAKRAGWPYMPEGNPLWALNWASWGNPAPTPMLGDVLVFRRDNGGHVGQYVGEDVDCYHVLGGNELDQVNIVRFPKERLFNARRAAWRIAQPANVRRIRRRPEGSVSGNEA